MTLRKLKKKARKLDKSKCSEYDVDVDLDEAGTQLDYLLAAHQMLDQVEGSDIRRIQELLLVKIRESERQVERQECPECEGSGEEESIVGNSIHFCRNCGGRGRVFTEKEETDAT